MIAIDKMMKKGNREFALSIKRLVMGQSVPGLLNILDGMIDDYDEDAVLYRMSITNS